MHPYLDPPLSTTLQTPRPQRKSRPNRRPIRNPSSPPPPSMPPTAPPMPGGYPSDPYFIPAPQAHRNPRPKHRPLPHPAPAQLAQPHLDTSIPKPHSQQEILTPIPIPAFQSQRDTKLSKTYQGDTKLEFISKPDGNHQDMLSAPLLTQRTSMASSGSLDVALRPLTLGSHWDKPEERLRNWCEEGRQAAISTPVIPFRMPIAPPVAPPVVPVVAAPVRPPPIPPYIAPPIAPPIAPYIAPPVAPPLVLPVFPSLVQPIVPAVAPPVAPVATPIAPPIAPPDAPIAPHVAPPKAPRLPPTPPVSPPPVAQPTHEQDNASKAQAKVSTGTAPPISVAEQPPANDPDQKTAHIMSVVNEMSQHLRNGRATRNLQTTKPSDVDGDGSARRVLGISLTSDDESTTKPDKPQPDPDEMDISEHRNLEAEFDASSLELKERIRAVTAFARRIQREREERDAARAVDVAGGSGVSEASEVSEVSEEERFRLENAKKEEEARERLRARLEEVGGGSLGSVASASGSLSSLSSVGSVGSECFITSEDVCESLDFGLRKAALDRAIAGMGLGRGEEGPAELEMADWVDAEIFGVGDGAGVGIGGGVEIEHVEDVGCGGEWVEVDCHAF